MLDYLLHAGSENVVIYFRDNLYVIKTLKEFQYIDEEGKDQGANVRQKAKDISNLLTDESRLRQERRSRASMRDRMAGTSGTSRGMGEDDEIYENENVRRRSRSLPPRRATGRGGREDDDMRRAIEESKRTAAEEESRQGTMTAEERDLQQAIKLSEEEERKRNEAITNANQSSLFDEQQNQLCVHSSYRFLYMPLTTVILQNQSRCSTKQYEPIPAGRYEFAVWPATTIHADATPGHVLQSVPAASAAGSDAGQCDSSSVIVISELDCS